MQMRYDGVARALHWSMAVLIVLAAAMVLLTDDIADKALERQMVLVHQALGLAVLVLVVARIGWRLFNSPPPPVADTSAFMLTAAKAGHWALYALMVLVPFVGLMLAFLRKDGVVDLWIVQIQSPFTPNRALSRSVKEVHEVLAYGLLGLSGFHVAIALWHQYIRRDNLLGRMA